MDVCIKIVIVLISSICLVVIAENGSLCESYYLPHPSDCTQFYQCSPNGTYVLHTCPDQLHFNPILHVCDYPDRAGCLNYNGSTIFPTTDTTTETITDFPTSTESATSTSEITIETTSQTKTEPTTTGIPEYSTDTTIEHSSTETTTQSYECKDNEYLPHEEDCEAFYRCIDGAFILLYCPIGMHFNILTNACESPELGNCKEKTTQLPETTTNHVSTDMCSNNEYRPHPSDCEAFFRCIGGEFILLFCPIDMHFNPNTRECETPESAMCEESFESSTEKSCANDEYHAHPTDCEAFYRCMNGTLILFYCPLGMHFNLNTKECDYPGCSSQFNVRKLKY